MNAENSWKIFLAPARGSCSNTGGCSSLRHDGPVGLVKVAPTCDGRMVGVFCFRVFAIVAFQDLLSEIAT
jgi:hypothetical protein